MNLYNYISFIFCKYFFIILILYIKYIYINMYINLKTLNY